MESAGSAISVSDISVVYLRVRRVITSYGYTKRNQVLVIPIEYILVNCCKRVQTLVITPSGIRDALKLNTNAYKTLSILQVKVY